jgi:hypothetical protein
MLGLISCDQPIGKWSDVIKFSKTQLSFDAQGGTETITSVGNWWWIIDLSAENNRYRIGEDEDHWYLYEKTESGKYEKLDVYEVIADSNDYNHITYITGPWFTINKETRQKITFSVLPNDTEKDRTLWLEIEAGDYFTGITLTQSANK